MLSWQGCAAQHSENATALQRPRSLRPVPELTSSRLRCRCDFNTAAPDLCAGVAVQMQHIVLSTQCAPRCSGMWCGIGRMHGHCCLRKPTLCVCVLYVLCALRAAMVSGEVCGCSCFRGLLTRGGSRTCTLKEDADVMLGAG